MTRFSTYCLFIAAALVGCKSRSDLVEAELRYKDRQLRETQGELERSAMLNEAYEQTMREQRFINPARPACAHSVIKQIQIGRGTSGIDEDNCRGDEGIQVIIVPIDGDGSAVKVGGTARVTAWQITPEGLKVPLSQWEVSAGHLQRNWRTGLLSTGYYVALPWQVLPCQDRLRVIVTFTTTDGAVFEAERDIPIRIGPIDTRQPLGGPQLGQPQPATAPATGPGPIIPPPSVPPPEQLPPPNPGQVLPPPVPAGPSTSWKPARL
jgi:hypothetical protein